MLPLLIPAAVSTIMGAYQTYQSSKGLNALQKQPFPEPEESPELRGAYSRAQQDAQFGFSPAETAAHQTETAQEGNLAYRRGLDLGGGSLAKALNSGIQAMQLGSANQFAKMGAGLRQQKIRNADTLAQALQRQSNLKQQALIHHRMALEQAYGGGLSSGLGNIAGGLEIAGLGLYGKGLQSPSAQAFDAKTATPYADKIFPVSRKPFTGLSMSPQGDDDMQYLQHDPSSWGTGLPKDLYK